MVVAESRTNSSVTCVASLFAFLLLLAVGAFASGCNEHTVEYNTLSGGAVYNTPIEFAGAAKVDLLWVIDNSGSMCQEQAALQDNFDKFITNLRELPTDFHIAVTTTHMTTRGSSLEPVAEPGRLQSTPQPKPGFDPTCQYDSTGGKKTYGPIRDHIQRAISCTKNPSRWSSLKNPSRDKIACAVDSDKAACRAAGLPDDGSVKVEDLFPDSSAYRSIPKVLRARDYEREDGALRVGDLKRDFTCMSLVGTRGDAFEQGLRAATKAVSPEMTGGAADVKNPENPDAPNHGFIRKHAYFGVVFVTDENDCSHNGELDRGTSCVDDICYHYTKEGADESPLLSVKSLYEDLKKNLAASKGLEKVPEEKLLLATVHGGYEPYQSYATPPAKTSQCDTAGYTESKLQCDTGDLQARSGDRYEDFVELSKQHFPESPEDGSHLAGYLCREDGIRIVAGKLGDFFRRQGSFCIKETLESCTSSADCGPSEYGMSGQKCAPPKGGSHKFCRSSTQLRLVSRGEKTLSDLEDLGFCIGASVETQDGTPECVVKPSLYTWTTCKGGPGVTYEFNDSVADQIYRKLSGYDIHARYVVETGIDDDPSAQSSGLK